MKKMSTSSLVLLFAIVIILILQIPNGWKWALSGVLFAAWLLLKWGNVLYVAAYKEISNGKATDKSWKKLQKALKLGIPDQFRLTAASLYIQKGDWHEGKRILDDFIAKPQRKTKNEKETQELAGLVNVARTMRSMAFWLDGDLDGAIKEMEAAYESGYRDKNMYINYETYLLEKGDLETAKKLLEESEQFGKTSPGLQDNQGWYYLQTGDWDKALAIYGTLIDDNPRFPEPYVHMAQIKIHYGAVKEALDLLTKAKAARHTQTSSIKEPFIQALQDRLTDPKTRMVTAWSIDAQVKEVAKGVLPAMLENTYEPTEEDVLPGFEKPAEKSEDPVMIEEAKEVRKEDEDREPDTDLSSDDDAYLKSHGLS